ncbi:MAG: NAD(+) salvage pathway protein [Pycnora praestabilis]|nr:MAG: NAD(+) salvage pathway protein [Pycnora praestabilis]
MHGPLVVGEPEASSEHQAASRPPFKPALLIVDLQEDFLPPNGTLAVPNGQDVIPVINDLLSLPFVLKIATKDWHPPSHVSFASNHKAPDDVPFESFVEIENPENADEKMRSRLWPVHCVQGTPGAELVDFLATSELDEIIEKGTDGRVEMYSAFRAPFTSPVVSDSGLADKLRAAEITHVYVVGLALDYCVRCTAVDAREEGLEVCVVREGTRAVGGKEDTEEEFERVGVRLVGVDEPEVRRMKDYRGDEGQRGDGGQGVVG